MTKRYIPQSAVSANCYTPNAQAPALHVDCSELPDSKLETSANCQPNLPTQRQWLSECVNPAIGDASWLHFLYSGCHMRAIEWKPFRSPLPGRMIVVSTATKLNTPVGHLKSLLTTRPEMRANPAVSNGCTFQKLLTYSFCYWIATMSLCQLSLIGVVVNMIVGIKHHNGRGAKIVSVPKWCLSGKATGRNIVLLLSGKRLKGAFWLHMKPLLTSPPRSTRKHCAGKLTFQRSLVCFGCSCMRRAKACHPVSIHTYPVEQQILISYNPSTPKLQHKIYQKQNNENMSRESNTNTSISSMV